MSKIDKNAITYTIVVARCSLRAKTRMTSGVIYFSATNVGPLVTARVPIRLVINNLSLFFLSFASVLAQNRFCRKNVSIL